MATITGTTGNNNLTGTSGDDFIYGLAGDDTLDGGLGNDLLDGGDSKSGDTAKYATAASAVVVNLSTGTATGGAGNDTLISIENITGSAYADNLTGDANSNLLDGRGGSDILDGGDGDDSLSGGGGNDTLYGGAGYDTLEGGAGNDILDGGPEGKGKGNGDTAQYATAASAVVVNLSTGTATGGAGSDTLISMENITGSSFADTLTGDANPNRLNGGEGNDILFGGDGPDSLYGDTGSDTLLGGEGDDYLDDSSWMQDGIADINALDGGSGNDTFYVYSVETIDSSILTGGEGADWFYLDPGNLSALTVTDFAVGAGGDVIDINNLIYSSSGYSSGNPFDPAQGYLRLVQSGADTELKWDQDGAAAGDYGWQTVLTLQNINLAVTPLTLENFSPRVPVDGSNTGLTLTGDAGDNYLEGTLVDDTLYGLAGYDTLYGYAGNDHLEGGEDGDYLFGDSGSDTLLGGAGDDNLSDQSWMVDGIADNNTLDGGSGDDTFYVSSTETIDSSVLTGGTGTDRLYLDPYNLGALTVTDFTVGAGGDVIGINDLIYNSSGYSSGNPFDPAQGYLRLVQSGADTELQWDRDGAAAGDYGWQTVLTLQNINLAVTPLTLENFSPRVSPDGSNTGLTLNGDAGDNYLEGTLFGDNLYGLAGYDTLLGYAGDDHLEGGEDDDSLYGDSGTDTLLGGAGSDYLAGGEGDDTLYGDDGNDSLYGDSGNDLLIGGEGDDYLDGGMEGKSGTGSDTASYSIAASAVVVNLSLGTAIGGAGNDSLTGIENILGSLHADTLTGDDNPNVLDGNAGADSLKGESGDDSYIVDDAGDTVTEKLNQGIDHVSSSVTYMLSTNVENLTLTGALAINGTGNVLANIITGNAATNQIKGGAGNDILNGEGGNDALNGGTGADDMKGGLGNDNYVVDDAGDIITENSGEGTDKVSSSVTYSLSANMEHLTLTGVLAIDGTGNGQANKITGNSANNILVGAAGNDTLDGKGGTNTLAGGAGKDKFKFTTTGHIDTITDFVVIDDTIQLENAVFTSLTTTGTLTASQFVIGTDALDANDFIIYNNATGALLYDADGSGGGAAVQIATVGTGLAMTNADFVVI